MPRIRTVKPELFKHRGLFNAEISSKFPIRSAFIALLTCCDREGRFRWQPERLKLDMLPYDKKNNEKVLNTLVNHGFVKKYEYENEWYAYIPTFTKHQHINPHEAQSILPIPPELINSTTSEQTTIDTILMPTKVQIIFEHWKAVMQHPDAKLDAKREVLINKALSLGYTSEQLCNAITGCSLTPYNMGDNKDGERYDGLHIILRDADQIDRFIRHFTSPPKPMSEAERLTQHNIKTMQSWVQKKLQEGDE